MRSGEIETHIGSSFFWQGSLWTAHELVAGAKNISFPSQEKNFTATRIEAAPRVGYVRYQSTEIQEAIKSAAPKKGENIRCWGNQDQKPISSQGRIQKINVVVQYKQRQTVPLLQLSCSTEPEMKGGAVTNEDGELVGMILLTGTTTYALEVARLTQTMNQLGFHVADEVVVSSIHPDVPVGAEVLSVSRYGQSVDRPYLQLLSTERIKVQMLDDTQWVFPLQMQYHSITLFEEENQIRRVMVPSFALYKQGINEQDIWIDHPTQFIQRIKRESQELYMLNPEYWRDKNRKKTPSKK